MKANASLKIIFVGDNESEAAANYQLRVLDFCTDEPLEQAWVWLDSKFVGQTDAEGLVDLGLLKKKSYILRVVKDGYTDSDLDTLRNDGFTLL